MRALYFPKLLEITVSHGDQITISEHEAKNELHHLLNVIRIKQKEPLLLLDGQGKTYQTSVESISRKSLVVVVQNSNIYQLKQEISLGICIPQKDAMDLILKNSTELGIRYIHPLVSQFSCPLLKTSPTRIRRILASAVEQSNNPFIPQICDSQLLSNFSFDQYQSVLYFCSHSNRPQTTQAHPVKLSLHKSLLLIIGPEGGLSKDEEDQLSQLSNCHFVHLELPILRSPTAVCAAMGYLHACL